MSDSGPSSEKENLKACLYVMIGGFLGAGKTTSIARLARHLADQGRRVGLITNDQGHQLVDTAFLASKGFPVEEIAGGCFCCRFNSLTDAAQNLSRKEAPDVFIAEPVGSCTDLVATVSYPLRRLYGDNYSLAPLSVVVDPIRARRLFGLEEGGRFSDKVSYIYKKQLEEADLIVLNKSDLLTGEHMSELASLLHESFPQAKILQISAREETGLQEWFDQVTTGVPIKRPTMEVDYQVYGEGEALLGWLNATLDLSSDVDLDGNSLLRQMAEAVQNRLNTAGTEVAHLKMTLDPGSGLGDLAVINLVRNDYVPELSQSLESDIDGAQLIVNLRAEASPEDLGKAVREAVDEIGQCYQEHALKIAVAHLEHFRPGQPVPIHRDTMDDHP